MTWKLVDFDKKYDRSKFDCGEVVLDDYLKKHMSNDVKRKANVPVLAINANDEAIGFYTLSSGAVEFQNFPIVLKNKIAPYPVPIIRIGRLAVDKGIKGQGLGQELLFHAIDRSEQASTLLGIRAVIVDAKNVKAENFYLHYGFRFLKDTIRSRKSLFLMI